MSKSLSVLVLLPMDEYNSFDTYREDDRLKQIYSEVPKAENYFKPLRIRSLYTSDKAVELIGCQYSSDFGSEEDSGQGSFKNNTFDIELDYEGDMDGKLLVSLIVGKYLAGRVNGIAVAEYD